MGAQHSKKFRQFDSISEGWHQLESYNNTILWTNPSTGEQIEEYLFLSANQDEFKYQEDAFIFRLNSPFLVESKSLKRQIRNQVCATIFQGNLYLQRISFRLSKIKQIPFPDNLHIYSQAFQGFDILQKQVGPFQIEEDMIGINNRGIVKVWVNADFSKSTPQREFQVTKITQKDMVDRIIFLVNQNTYQPSMPTNILQFFYIRDVKTLHSAHIAIIAYAQLNKMSIPERMDCVFQETVEPISAINAMMTFGSNLANKNTNNSITQKADRIVQNKYTPLQTSAVQPPFHVSTPITTFAPLPKTKSYKQIQNYPIFQSQTNTNSQKQNLAINYKSHRPQSAILVRNPSTPVIPYSIQTNLHSQNINKLSNRKYGKPSFILESFPSQTDLKQKISPLNITSQQNIYKYSSPKPKLDASIANNKSLNHKSYLFKKTASPINHNIAPITSNFIAANSAKSTYHSNSNLHNIGKIQTINNYEKLMKNGYNLKSTPGTPMKKNNQYSNRNILQKIQNEERIKQKNNGALRYVPQYKPPIEKTTIAKQYRHVPSIWQKLQQNNRLNYHNSKTINQKIIKQPVLSNQNSVKKASYIAPYNTKKIVNRSPTPKKDFHPLKILVPSCQPAKQYVHHIQQAKLPEFKIQNYCTPVPLGQTHLHDDNYRLVAQNAENRYLQIQNKMEKTRNQVLSLIQNSKQIHKGKLINQNLTVQDKFAPNVEGLYGNIKPIQKTQLKSTQLAGSHYISSRYVPLSVGYSTQTKALQDYHRFQMPLSTTQRHYISSNDAHIQKSGIMSSAQNHQKKIVGADFRQVLRADSGFAQQSSSLFSKAIFNKNMQFSRHDRNEKIQNWQVQEDRSSIRNQYRGMDSQLLDDLQRIKLNLPLNR